MISKTRKIIIELIALLKDICKSLKLTKCDVYDIIEIIGFGMVINSLYGLSNATSLKDIYVLLLSLFSAVKARRNRKDERCLK